MLKKEKDIDMATVVKYGTLPQRGMIRTRERAGKNEVVIETNGIGFAIQVPLLLDFLREARII